jgi:transcriptional regulator with XRE-family HTH domain
MPSKLGVELRRARKSRGLGLRELARLIGKSPAYLVALESADPLPGISEETLRALASELGLSADLLTTLAGKTPDAVRPRTEADVSLYRLIRGLPAQRKAALVKQLRREYQRRKPREER